MHSDEKMIELLRGIFEHMHIRCGDEQLVSLVQFIKFGIVGITNTAISYFINISVLLLLEKYHLPWDYIAGNLTAFFLSVLWSFYWNNKYVFSVQEGQKRSLGKTLIKTYIAYSFTGIFLSNLLSYIWIDLLHISKYIAPIINLLITVPLNFIINKKWAFRIK